MHGARQSILLGNGENCNAGLWPFLDAPDALRHRLLTSPRRGQPAWHPRMTKSELIAELAEANPHLLSRDVELIVSTIFDEITAALARGARVELRGFGAFTVKRRDARTGRNPRTGEAVDVDAKRVPYFKPGKEMRERLNLQEVPAE